MTTKFPALDEDRARRRSGRVAAVVAVAALCATLTAAPAGAATGVQDAVSAPAASAMAGASAVAAAPASAPASVEVAPEAGPAAAPPTTVTADPLPTVQIDGIVWAQAIVGARGYAGGQFASARPAGASPGTGETPRANLLRYDIETGVLDASWNPGANGKILAMAVSPDGSRLYVGGTFTQIAGQARYRLAAFDTATGALLTDWRPGTNSTVYGLAASSTSVFVTGEFTNINNTPRTKVAAVGALNGATLPFDPVLAGGYGGRAVEVSPDGSKVVVAGSFTSTNGSTNPGRGMAAVDATSGATLPWAVNETIRNAGNNAAIYSLASDGDSVYGSGYDFGGTKTEDDFEGAFRASWADGSMVWMEDCHGDTYSVYPSGGEVYVAGHSHYCGNIGEFPQTDPWTLNHSLAFSKEPSDRTITPDIWGYRSFTGKPAGKLQPWYPIWGTGSVSGVAQAGWDITGNDKYLVYGGEFTRVSGVRQQGIVRFAKRGVAPAKIGPSVQGDTYKITPRSIVSGQVRVTWPANYDPDSPDLTYELFRRGTAAAVSTQTASSTFWVRPAMSFTDKNLTPGSTQEYRVRVTDGDGNSTVSSWTSIVVADEGSSTSYDNVVLEDSPVNYWPLNEANGAAAFDWASGNDLSYSSGVTPGLPGKDVPPSATATATRFSGSNAFGVTRSTVPGPQSFSVEAWFRTTSSSGGKIVGFGNASSGTSSSYDRHIYLSNTGRLTFGVYPGAVREITTTETYRDGDWHHVVGTLDGTGMALFVDGVRVGTRSDTTGAQAYNGFWRVGGDSQSTWPNGGSSNYLNGTIANVAVYDRALDRATVDRHWSSSGRPSQLVPVPADAYGAAVQSLDPTLYWRLGETTGSTAADTGQDRSTGSYSGPVAKGVAGALAGVADTGVRFAPTKNASGTWTGATVASTRSYANPTTYSVETWFKTDTTTGGKLIGFGSSRTSTSSNFDRHVYMTASGQLKFGTYDGSERVVTSPGTYRDGVWHHVVATQSADGMRLFVDGALVGSDPAAVPESYTGYWRIGGDSGWEGDTYWKGSLDEVAVYGAALTPAQVLEHYELGTGAVPNVAPTAQFTAGADDLDASFDASASSDPDGAISSYTWDFGDSTAGTGQTTTHTYGAPGTYPVVLTVTDDDGATASVTHDVTVTAANIAPTAAFSSGVDHLTVAVDATGSTDPDGSVASYAWDFGDQTQGTGATATHTYAEAGTYTVKLTVTDDAGASATAQSQVTAVAPPAASVVGLDTFERTGSGGWGTAEVGGAWSALGGNAAFTVEGGRGVMSLAPSHTREARLGALALSGAQVSTRFAADVGSVGGTTSISVIGRQVGTNSYSSRVRLEPNGLVRLYLLRNETLLGNQLLPITYAPGQELSIRSEVVGANPTQLAVKVWPSAQAEPAAWTLTATDGTAGFQAAGPVSLKVAVSSVSTNPLTRVSFDDFRVTDPLAPAP